MNGRFHHYTDIEHLSGILLTGMIEPRTDSAWYNPHGVPPLVWTSAATPWEPICSVTLAIGPGSGLRRGTVPGLPHEAARIRIRPETSEAWDIAMAKCGCHWSTIMRLAQVGYEQASNPRRWRASRRPVTAETWLGIELWDGESWRLLPRAGDIYSHQDLEAFMTDASITHPLLRAKAS